MDSIYVSFSLKSFISAENDSLEKDYQEIYKPLIKFLYKNSFPFSFSFSGCQTHFLRKKHSEFNRLVSEMLTKKKFEVYGGGYYNPVLPLLQPSDRNGQIDLLSTEITQCFGKLPHGITFFVDAWDSTLVQNMTSCGMKYALLEESLIPEDRQKFVPIIMADLGKNVDIYYFSDDLKNDLITNGAESFIHNLQSKVAKMSKKDDNLRNCPRIVNISFDHSDIRNMLSANRFEELLEYFKTNESNIIFSTVQDYSEAATVKIPAYVSGGINRKIAKWSEVPYEESEKKPSRSFTIYDYLDTYSQCRNLYNRMLYVSMLVNQIHGDKLKKRAAREIMWEAQNGEGLVCTDICHYSRYKNRQISYHLLMDTEKLVREVSDFKESVLSFDYNYDGHKEYVCRMKDYFTVIGLQGGSIREFEPLKNGYNYCDNYLRLEKFDGYADGYIRGFFIDHIFTENQFEKYIRGEVCGDGIFSKVLYEEVKFSSNQKEITLRAQAVCGGQNLVLTKKFIINSSGMNIQYLIRNESDSVFQSKFCVESNFTDVHFTTEKTGNYKVLLVTDTEAKEVDSEKFSVECFENGSIPDINVVQIFDEEEGISFSFEPNENCSYCFYPLSFKRPDTDTKENKVAGKTYVSTLFWNLEIEPGKEIEKNFNFAVYTPRKNRKKK